MKELSMARREFARHVSEGYFRVHPITLFTRALGMLDAAAAPLRTLDTLHLAAFTAICDLFASTDKIIAQAAEPLGMHVQPFFA